MITSRADEPRVERALARIFLSLGLLAASLTLSGWWTERTMLDPHQTSRMVDSVVSQPKVRAELVKVISTAVAQQSGVPQAQVAAIVESRLEANTDLSFLGPVITDAHSRLLGDSTGPVQLDPALVTPLIGEDLAKQAGPLTWNVPTVAPLKSAKDRLSSLISLGLLLSIGFVTAGFLLHPRKDKALRMVGAWAIGACLWQLAVAWVFPVVVLPRLTDNPWVGIASGVAEARLAPLVGILLSLAGFGAACILLSLFIGDPGRRARVLAASVGPPLSDAPLATAMPVARNGWSSSWPSTRASRRRPFGPTHRRTASGQDPDHDGDWLL